ncbi:hypothetical protein CP8484711_1055B, partial [Chlamydia psittaci 84-8471/1]
GGAPADPDEEKNCL